MTPDPPQRGQKLTIYLNGTLLETVNDGSAHVKVKLGFIQLVDTDYDICEQVDKVDQKCPLEKGTLSVVHEFDVPNEIPPVCGINKGHYRVHVNAYLADSTPITCLDADFRM